MITLAIALPVIVIIVKLILNVKAWHSRKPVKHFKEWLVMAAVCVPSIIIFALHLHFKVMLFGFDVGLILDHLVPAGMVAFFIWFFFDGFYNVARNYAWFFTGSDDKDDAKTDNLLQKLPLWLHIVLKIGGLAGFILLYVYFYNS